MKITLGGPGHQSCKHRESIFQNNFYPSKKQLGDTMEENILFLMPQKGAGKIVRKLFKKLSQKFKIILWELFSSYFVVGT